MFLEVFTLLSTVGDTLYDYICYSHSCDDIFMSIVS